MTMSSIYAGGVDGKSGRGKKKVDEVENVTEKEKEKNASPHSHQRERYLAPANLYDWYVQIGDRG